MRTWVEPGPSASWRFIRGLWKPSMQVVRGLVVSRRPWLVRVRDVQAWCVRVEPMSLHSMARLERILRGSEINVDRAFVRLRGKMKIKFSLF